MKTLALAVLLYLLNGYTVVDPVMATDGRTSDMRVSTIVTPAADFGDGEGYGSAASATQNAGNTAGGRQLIYLPDDSDVQYIAESHRVVNGKMNKTHG